MAKSFEAELEREKHIPLERWPDFMKNRPSLHHALYFYVLAFYDLSTCRHIGMGVGPIPYTAIVTYMDEAGISGESDRNRFCRVIRACDDSYVSAIQEKHEQEERMDSLKRKR